MPKAGKKNHIFGDFFSEATKKNAKTGKEFGIEGKKGLLSIDLELRHKETGKQ